MPANTPPTWPAVSILVFCNIQKMYKHIESYNDGFDTNPVGGHRSIYIIKNHPGYERPCGNGHNGEQQKLCKWLAACKIAYDCI
jgi:hypothetical protein